MQQRNAGPFFGRYVLPGRGRSTEASRPFGVSGLGFPGTLSTFRCEVSPLFHKDGQPVNNLAPE